ncbi:actin-related protein 2/3 complex subunit 5-like [Mizuhopecten yessoensis]|uniref:actin-related protein 2/3 complex subunit 5-like n=1 Tax=Mizuhopecten yessoensis TaxID=6573 RepID=UPI000B45747E|nr:actin-related protein 2/3 complex subunit 5-like [Mizuhopecten yessoensis]
MSKNTGASKFRKVNVDQFDEDLYEDEEDDQEVDVGPNEGEVNTLLAQSKQKEALAAALKNPPIGRKNQALKDKSTNLVVRVLQSFKSNEIESCVKTLDAKSIDILMKYIYKGFEFPTENSSASLLGWHDKVFAKAGQGCIIRVLTDKKHL